ncbi:hypothetical protein CRYUN_Cryun09bG0038800 [Craigia yunnanensis]
MSDDAGEGVEVKYEKAYIVEPKSAVLIDQLTMHSGVLGVGGRIMSSCGLAHDGAKQLLERWTFSQKPELVLDWPTDLMSGDKLGKWSSGANGGGTGFGSGGDDDDDDYSDEMSGSNMPLSPPFPNPSLFSFFIAISSFLLLYIIPLSSML